MSPDVAVCEGCGWATVPARPAWQRLPDMAGLLVALALMAALCRVVQHVLGL
jgi:hypothetical protein